MKSIRMLTKVYNICASDVAKALNMVKGLDISGMSGYNDHAERPESHGSGKIDSRRRCLPPPSPAEREMITWAAQKKKTTFPVIFS